MNSDPASREAPEGSTNGEDPGEDEVREEISMELVPSETLLLGPGGDSGGDQASNGTKASWKDKFTFLLWFPHWGL